MDRSDSEDLMNVLRTELGFSQSKVRFPLKATCLDIYSRCVNTQGSLSTIVKEDFPWVVGQEDRLGELFAAYVDRKRICRCARL